MQPEHEITTEEMTADYARCVDCQSPVRVKAPVPLYFNHPATSLIVIPHEEPLVCENCGTRYAFVIHPEGCTLNVQLNKLPSESRLVKPLLFIPGSMREH